MVKCHIKAYFTSPLEPAPLSTVHQPQGQHTLHLSTNMQNAGDGPSGRRKGRNGASKIDIWQRNAIFIMSIRSLHLSPTVDALQFADERVCSELCCSSLR